MSGSEFDPVIHQPTRLRIMAALYRNRQAAFVTLRDGLALTDGNLATHVARLVDAGYVEARRRLVALHFEVVYSITPRGSEAFRAYAERLRAFLDVDAVAPGSARLPTADVQPSSRTTD
ncbi:MAG: transcriptional regulator [Thermoplasmatota archaeon]